MKHKDSGFKEQCNPNNDSLQEIVRSDHLATYFYYRIGNESCKDRVGGDTKMIPVKLVF